MFDYLVSTAMESQFPNLWPVISLWLAGKCIYNFLRKRYIELGLYETGADFQMTAIALIASAPFVVLTGFTPMVGISLNIALRLTENMVLMPVLTHIFAYLIRCLFASVVEVAFCSAAWNFYLKGYIDRTIWS